MIALVRGVTRFKLIFLMAPERPELRYGPSLCNFAPTHFALVSVRLVLILKNLHETSRPFCEGKDPDGIWLPTAIFTSLSLLRSRATQSLTIPH